MDLDPQQRPGRVLSVNTGVPRVLIDHQGRQWTTAILKSPVAGRVAVHGVNLEGDDQADRRVHGGPHKAVYAYAAADVAWWAAGMERELLPGAFGENLTVEGVDVSGAVVGERWRVGTALLEISQPRIPCPKLGVAMGDPHFPRDFADAERPGAYLRIIEAGEIGAGDDIERVAVPAHGLSVAEVFRAYRGRGDRGVAQRMVEVPELPQRWRDWARQHLSS